MTEGHISAGDFSIEEATLILSGGETLDISGVIVEIEFFESIDSPAISGIVTFANAEGWSNLGPIIGQEFLKLKIKTPSYDEKNEFDFTKNVLHVTNVTAGKVGNGGEVLFLHVITSEIVKNEQIIVSRSMEGTYSDFVTELLKKDLKSTKPLDIQKTSGIKRYVLPRSKPFDLIKNFRRKAVSADNVQSPSPTFVFFENFRGYHFKTLEKLYAQEPVMAYFESSIAVTTKDNGDMGIDDAESANCRYHRELSTIKISTVVNDKDTLKNISMGALSSELNTFDLVTKQSNGGKGPTSPFKYNYFEDRKNEKHINSVSTNIDGKQISDNPIYSDVTNNGNRISDHSSVHFLSFTATDPASGGDALHSVATEKANREDEESVRELNETLIGEAVVNQGGTAPIIPDDRIYRLIDEGFQSGVPPIPPTPGKYTNMGPAQTSAVPPKILLNQRDRPQPGLPPTVLPPSPRPKLSAKDIREQRERYVYGVSKQQIVEVTPRGAFQDDLQIKRISNKFKISLSEAQSYWNKQYPDKKIKEILLAIKIEDE